MAAAKDTEVQDLHGLLTRYFTKQITDEELTPALASTIAKFLKDNNVTCEEELTPELTDLKDEVAKTAKFNPEDVLQPLKVVQ